MGLSPAVRQTAEAIVREVGAGDDATQPPEAQDGTPLVCYGEQHGSEKDRTPITAGMVIAPDIEGRPTAYVADKVWFVEMFPVELGRPALAGGDASTSMGTGNSAGAGDGGTSREEVRVDPETSWTRCGSSCPPVSSSSRGVTSGPWTPPTR